MLETLSASVIENFLQHIEILLFLGSAFLGTPFIILISSLAEQAAIPIWKVFLFSVLGDISGAYLWFIIGRYLRRAATPDQFHTNPALQKTVCMLKRFISRNKMHAFAIPYVLYGTKVITFAYFGRTGISTREFFTYCAPMTVLWTALLIILGIAAGNIVFSVGSFIDSFISAVWFTVLLCAVVYLAVILSRRRMRF